MPPGSASSSAALRRRKILALSKDGKFTDFLADSEWPNLALTVDEPRRILWATTAAMPEGLDYKAADDGKSALPKISLESGKQPSRYDLPRGGKHALGDMTLSVVGDAYISDGYGAVYTVAHDRDRLELLNALTDRQQCSVGRQARSVLITKKVQRTRPAHRFRSQNSAQSSISSLCLYSAGSPSLS
jgi:hypothetical protein